ncbi:scavenger receptor class F member 2-like isoform X2 [Patella vulgata]|uniref:scavenger receptor class F member 2-like isoform X2 n=1 Tax=Patella vulgata TaxID=6465 RepID=UPI0024A80575|nr:scavenger receptor class F member 2-like isoform X2 [Patella vulgata]
MFIFRVWLCFIFLEFGCAFYLNYIICLFLGWSRLQGFEIRTGFGGQCNQTGFQSSTSCFKDTTSTIQSVYTVTGCNQGSSTSFSGRTAYVSSRNDSLTLCEVEIFSDLAQCNTGYYSTSRYTCQPCNTCRGDSCDSTTGVCTRDCKTGFYGTKRQQNCGNGCLNNQCSKSDGKCNDCKPDTVGPYCNLTCGIECQPSPDQTSVTCDRNGLCTNCIIGRYGDRCDMNCSEVCACGCYRNVGKCTCCIADGLGLGECTTISRVVYVAIGVLCGILGSLTAFLSCHLYKKRCDACEHKGVTVPDYIYSNTDLNPPSSTSDDAVTTAYQNIPTNTRNVEYENQSFNTEDNTINMYDTLDHTSDDTPNTYTSIK